MATVLVVEDQEEIAALIKFKLKNSGYDVVHAENGKLGLEAARSSPPDLILLDIMMPVMNGVEMLKELKADPNLKSIPVIMLTAQSSEPAVIGGFKLGADDFVTKPFKTQELVARIGAVLSRYKKTNTG